MKKIISIELAHALRASLNAQIMQLESITDELARIDIQQNPQDPVDQLTDAQLLNAHIEKATEALALADCMLSSQMGDSKIFTQPPKFVCWLMQAWGRK